MARGVSVLYTQNKLNLFTYVLTILCDVKFNIGWMWSNNGMLGKGPTTLSELATEVTAGSESSLEEG